MMQANWSGTALLLISCAHPQSSGTTAPQDLGIVLSLAVSNSAPVLIATVVNRGETPVCIATEALQNRYTLEMNLKLRDSSGAPLKHERPGFIPPPLQGTVRLEPGASTTGEYYIRARFNLRGTKSLKPGTASARAAFQYDHCDGSRTLPADSGWQRI